MIVWSVKQRLFYLLLVVAFFALLGSGLWYFNRPGPTCYDGEHNQDELDVDCGGVCAKVCPFEVKPLVAVWSRIFALAPGRYDVTTLLKNPNRLHAARSFAYRLRLFDRAGVMVTSREGEAFLNPAESLYLYEARLEAGNRVPERAVFDILEGPVWQRVEQTPVALKVSRKSFQNEPTPLLVAELENNALVDLENIQIVAVLSDESENAMAVSSTLVERLGRGERKEVSFTWPKPFAVEPTFFDLQPHYDLARVR